MTVYYAAFAWYFGTICLGAVTRSTRVLLVPAMAPLIALACMRGLVGTDTLFYMGLFDLMIASDGFLILFEPLFAGLVYVILMFTGDSHTALLLIAAVTTILLLTGALQLEHQPLLFATLIVPYFYLDLTMNAVRLGLAVGLSVWAIVFLSRGRVLWFLILAVIASQTHISSVMLTAGTWLLIETKIKTMLILSFLGAVAYAVLAEYLNAKFLSYTNIQTEAASAGVGPLALVVLILGTLAMSARWRQEHSVQLATMFVMACGFFLLSQFTYAGLRLFNNLQILIYLFVALSPLSHCISIQGKIVVMLLAVALMATSLRMRNYAASANDFIGAPYTPYHFVWERRL